MITRVICVKRKNLMIQIMKNINKNSLNAFVCVQSHLKISNAKNSFFICKLKNIFIPNWACLQRKGNVEPVKYFMFYIDSDNRKGKNWLFFPLANSF